MKEIYIYIYIYIYKKINKYCKENGIEKAYSLPYFQEINGKAEKTKTN